MEMGPVEVQRVTPTGDKWIGVRLKKPEKTISGIYSPESVEYPSQLIFVVNGNSTGLSMGDIALVRSHIGIPIEKIQIGTEFYEISVFIEKNILGTVSDLTDVYNSQISALSSFFKSLDWVAG